jgi:glycosyltransferase involved in cell wall biosynthesis
MSIDELMQVKSRLHLQGIQLVQLKYRRRDLANFFGWMANGIALLFLIFFRRVRYIHAWCATAGAVAYVLHVMSRRPLVVDSYEPHAEVMLETDTWKRNSLNFKVLFWLEKLQGKAAHALITCTADMKEYCQRKFGFEMKHQWVKPACVNLEPFNYSSRKINDLVRSMKLEGKIVGVYAGKFGGLYLTQEVFDFIKVAYDYWGDSFRMLLLTNESDEKLNAWRKKSNVPEGVILKKFVHHAVVANYIGLGDFGFSPYNPVPSRKYSAPIKNAEYWALGLPVVITNNIADDSTIIEQNGIGAVIKNLTPADYLEAVQIIDKLLKGNTTRQLYDRIRPFAEKYKNFSIADKIYDEIYGDSEKNSTPR